MITSYTLANWDGKLRDVSQQIPSYPSSSSTSLPGGESLNNCNSNEQMDVDKGGHSLDKPVERGRDENSEESLVCCHNQYRRIFNLLVMSDFHSNQRL